ncbi:MAG: FAD-dependent oxidoreductase [Tenericutes bacterium]|nr:FAD-dependent oxidoreductase [Mycoplasmatota bacterium]
MYDIIIIGCGPAGMTAGIYAARANKKVLIIEKETIGGQISSSPLVENYPGYKEISGSELANNMFEQVTALGVDVELDEVKKIEYGKIKKVITLDNVYESKVVIIATGSRYKLLGLKNEDNLIGNGIHFCVACDGAFFKDKIVAVIGGGNSAVINAITLSDICKKVYVIQIIDKLTAESTLVEKLKGKENVEIILNAKVTELIGEDNLQAIKVNILNKVREIKLDGMFISIGLIPQSDFVKELLPINKYGYIESNNCVTEKDGIFVAGDCRDKQIRQLTVATSDGTTAALDAIAYLNK